LGQTGFPPKRSKEPIRVQLEHVLPISFLNLFEGAIQQAHVAQRKGLNCVLSHLVRGSRLKRNDCLQSQ
jgi:hypothetical protein